MIEQADGSSPTYVREDGSDATSGCCSCMPINPSHLVCLLVLLPAGVTMLPSMQDPGKTFGSQVVPLALQQLAAQAAKLVRDSSTTQAHQLNNQQQLGRSLQAAAALNKAYQHASSSLQLQMLLSPLHAFCTLDLLTRMHFVIHTCAQHVLIVLHCSCCRNRKRPY